MHDLGKVLCLYGEPQWAVVGDTFPVGCEYSDQIVFPEFFATNPDSGIPATRLSMASTNRTAGSTGFTFRLDMMNIFFK